MLLTTDSETITLARNNTLSTTSGYVNPGKSDSGNIVYLENENNTKGFIKEDIKLIVVLEYGSDLNVSIYYDDFDEIDNFHRILLDQIYISR